jgi:hypothetical protein
VTSIPALLNKGAGSIPSACNVCAMTVPMGPIVEYSGAIIDSCSLIGDLTISGRCKAKIYLPVRTCDLLELITDNKWFLLDTAWH